MPPSEIRKEAREALNGKWKKAVCITLVFLAATFIIGALRNLAKEGTILYYIIDLAYLVISVPLSFGLLISFIKLIRNEDVSSFGFFKEGFSRFGKSWGIWFHTFIRLLLPIICLVLASLLMVLLSAVNIIAKSNLILTITILGIVLFIASIIYVVSRSLLYVIAYNISYDNPELSSKECVKKSEKFMKGNRGNYFLLGLSFIGWAILSVFTFGIGMLWLMPYMLVAVICFYERVSKVEKQETEPSKKVEE